MFSYFMADLTISGGLLASFVALSIYWIWTKTRRPYTKYNIPPFPVPPRFIVGHLLTIGDDFRNKVKEYRQKVGDVFSLDIGGRHYVIVCGYDNVKEVFVGHADKIPDTPRVFLGDVINENNMGIIAASGDNWKEQRSVSLSILRTFGMGKNILAEKIQEEMAVYIQKLADFKGRPADVKTITAVSISNVICSLIVGKRFDHDDPYFLKCMHSFDAIAKLVNKMHLLDVLPFLYYLPGDFFYAKQWVKHVMDTKEKFSRAYIKKIKETFREDEEPTNFIAAYLREQKKRKDSGEYTFMDEDNLIAVIGHLFIAGTETTSTTILWCMVYVLHHSEVQEKVYREIVNNIGAERPPGIHDRPKLPYLNAVIHETQRLSSLVLTSIRRVVRVPFELKGYTIPQGSIILSSLDSVLHDKNIWGDPDNFRPERFLDSTGNLLNPDELIPFSIGKRVCLGQSLARMELFLCLSALFQRFRLLPAEPGELPSLEGTVSVTYMPQDFKIRFIER